MPATYDVVIPTIGRASLGTLLRSLADSHGPLPGRVIVADDRPRSGVLDVLASLDGRLGPLSDRVLSVRSGGRGPAAARNAGWRNATAPWVAFLDDDVVVPADWRAALVRDLEALGPDAAATQGRIVVPHGTRPTDRERCVAGLERASWATADMAYRLEVLRLVGGFDERFPRAYREDADLALRTMDAGWTLATGERTVLHPVQPAPWWISIAQQAGNADDALMRRLHGGRWRRRARAGQGRLPMHVATVASAGVAAALALAGRRRGAAVAGAAWLGLTAEFAARRIAPGPRGLREIGAMLGTSVVIPFTAVRHRIAGELRSRGAGAWLPPSERRRRAVLLDRDGTLVVDVPYNGDPDRVAPVADAAVALGRLRAAGIPLGVVTNQSGVARGLLSADDVDTVNGRIEELLGPIGRWFVCRHGPDERCACRKPEPGLVLAAAEAMHVDPRDCVVIGDTEADLEAASRAGARGILVPNGVTRAEEVARAREVASSLTEAVELVLRGAR
jgi:histidinol-phosphate phosphatase family protein